MKVRRTKPYVCVDCDFADHARFQATEDVDAAAGTWLRCLAYSRAQQQDGVVKLAWLRRTFAASYGRIEELIKVGLLRAREDGDYEMHAYAPRNQTRAMMEEDRTATRERVREWRRSDRTKRDPVTEYKDVTSDDVTRYKGVTAGPVTEYKGVTSDDVTRYKSVTADPVTEYNDVTPLAPSATTHPRSSSDDAESADQSDTCESPSAKTVEDSATPVTCYKPVTNGDVTADVTVYENVCNALVPTSTSSSLSLSLASSCISPLSFSSLEASSLDFVSTVGAVPRADAPARTREARPPLPRSERSFSGPFWLQAFSEGISEQTQRPCTVGRMYLETLERVVAHHAPDRDVFRANAWLKGQAKAFAAQWDGKHPAKGLTPDGLERWLNEGRQAPPVFGRPRIVQPPAEQWHEDDWSDLGAKVDE